MGNSFRGWRVFPRYIAIPSQRKTPAARKYPAAFLSPTAGKASTYQVLLDRSGSSRQAKSSRQIRPSRQIRCSKQEKVCGSTFSNPRRSRPVLAGFCRATFRSLVWQDLRRRTIRGGIRRSASQATRARRSNVQVQPHPVGFSPTSRPSEIHRRCGEPASPGISGKLQAFGARSDGSLGRSPQVHCQV